MRTRRHRASVRGASRATVFVVVLLVGAALPGCLGHGSSTDDCAALAEAVSLCDEEPLDPGFLARCEAASDEERAGLALAGQACAASRADGIFGYLEEGEECWTNHLCGDGLVCRAVGDQSTCRPPGDVGASCDAGAAVIIPEGEDADCAEGLLCHGYICRSDEGGSCTWFGDCVTLRCSVDSPSGEPVGTCLPEE